MSFRQAADQPPELATTRVTGSGSARLIAVGVASLLVAVVGFVLVSRPPETPAPTNEAVAAAPTNTPSPTPLPSPDLFPVVVSPLRDYGFAALIEITGGRLGVPLKLDSAEFYRAEVTIPTAGLGKKLPIQIAHEFSRGSAVISEPFGGWSLPLKKLRNSPGGQVTLLVDHVPPDVPPGFAGAFGSGHTFTVTGYRRGDSFLLILELVWPATR